MFDEKLLNGVDDIDDLETFESVSKAEVIQTKKDASAVISLAVDVKSKMITINKSEYENMPAVAIDALRIISREYDRKMNRAK